ncbi:MAG: C40 family peptidase [Salinivirgaceae bacterium]|jgi:hypothetical protein|nr:C40 family peptidase [Salinivirgaceae bacterium]
MIKHGVCLHTLIPLRAECLESSELESQVLFGETYIINEMVEKWAFITTGFDNYSGWIDAKLINEIDETSYLELNDLISSVSVDVFSYLTCENAKIPLVAGSLLPNINKSGAFNIDGKMFLYKGGYSAKVNTGLDVVSNAYKFLNSPYLWGGRSVLGIDCSGFTQIVYKMAGIHLERNASMQVKQGRGVSFIDESRAGDLAFFDNKDGGIIHVGIVLNNRKIIHASGWVRIDKIDHQGIFNSETNKYTHKLRVLRRIIDYGL